MRRLDRRRVASPARVPRGPSRGAVARRVVSGAGTRPRRPGPRPGRPPPARTGPDGAAGGHQPRGEGAGPAPAGAPRPLGPGAGAIGPPSGPSPRAGRPTPAGCGPNGRARSPARARWWSGPPGALGAGGARRPGGGRRAALPEADPGRQERGLVRPDAGPASTRRPPRRSGIPPRRSPGPRRAPPLPAEVEEAVVQIMTYLVENETAALMVPARFLARLHPHFREVMALLSVQIADEARHIEVFTRRAAAPPRRARAVRRRAGGPRSRPCSTSPTSPLALVPALGARRGQLPLAALVPPARPRARSGDPPRSPAWPPRTRRGTWPSA